jgi:hypothetical protein
MSDRVVLFVLAVMAIGGIAVVLWLKSQEP